MNTVREAAATKSGNPLCDKSHVELTLRVMPPGTSSRNRLATPVTCRRCGMNTVREAAVRVMPPATETGWLEVPHKRNEVTA